MIKKLPLIILASVILSGCIPNFGVAEDSSKEEFTKNGVSGNFPPIPFYQEAKVLEGYSQKDGAGATALTDDPLQKVLDFYNETLPLAGWEHTLAPKGSSHYVYEVRNSTHHGQVIVNTAEDGKKTAITISLTSR